MSPVARFRTAATNTNEVVSRWRNIAPTIPYVFFILAERRFNYHPEMYDEVDRALLVEYPRSYPLMCHREFVRHLRRHFRVERNDPISYIDDTGEEAFIRSQDDFTQALQLAFDYRKSGKAVILLVDKFDLRPDCFSPVANREELEDVRELQRNDGDSSSPPCSGACMRYSDDSESSMSETENESINEVKVMDNFTEICLLAAPTTRDDFNGNVRKQNERTVDVKSTKHTAKKAATSRSKYEPIVNVLPSVTRSLPRRCAEYTKLPRRNVTGEPSSQQQNQPTPSTSGASLGRNKKKEEKRRSSVDEERKRIAAEEEKKREAEEEKKRAAEEERKKMNDYYYGRNKTPGETREELNQIIPAQVLLKVFEKKIQYIDEEIKKITARRDRGVPYVATESDVEEEELPNKLWMQMSQEAIQARKYNTRIRHLKLRKKETEESKEICQILMESVDQYEKENEQQEVFTERYDLPENPKIPIMHGRNILECGNCSRKTSDDNEAEDTQVTAKSKDNGVRITCYISFPDNKNEQSRVNRMDTNVTSANFTVAEEEDNFELVKAHCSRQNEPKSKSGQPEIDEDKFSDGKDSPSFELVSESPSPAKSINLNDEHLTQKKAEESPLKILNEIDTDESSSWAEVSYNDDKPCLDQEKLPRDVAPHKTKDDYIFVHIDHAAEVKDSSNSMMKSSQTDNDDVKTSHSSYPSQAEMAELKHRELPATQRSCQSQTDSDDFAQSFHSHTTSVTENDFYSGRKLAEDKQSSSIAQTDKEETQEPPTSNRRGSSSSSHSSIQQPSTSASGSGTQRKFEEVEIEELSDSVHILPETLVTGAASIASMAYCSARDVLGKLRAHTKDTTEIPKSSN